MPAPRPRWSASLGIAVALFLAAACSEDATAPAARGCTLVPTPAPGTYANHLVVGVRVDGSLNGLRLARHSLPATAAPDPLPATPAEATEPAASRELPSAIVLEDGYHELVAEHPCGGWVRWVYLVDSAPPAIRSSEQGGLYRGPVTVALSSPEPGAQVFFRAGPTTADATGDFGSAGTKAAIQLADEGDWRIEAYAADRAGNRSPVTDLSFRIRRGPLLQTLRTPNPVDRVALLPRLDATFDRPMATSVTRLADAITFPAGGAEPADLLLFWENDRSLMALADRALPPDTDLRVSVSGLLGTGGWPVSVDNIAAEMDLTTRTAPAGGQAGTIEPDGPTVVTAGADPATVVVVFDPPPAATPNPGIIVDDLRGGLSPAPATAVSVVPVDAAAGRYEFRFPADLLPPHLSSRLIVSVDLGGVAYEAGERLVLYRRPATPVTAASPPRFTAMEPADGATAAPGPILITASDPLDLASLVAAAAVTVARPGAGVLNPGLAASYLPGSDGRTAAIWTDPPLAAGDGVTVGVAGGAATDLPGRSLPAGLAGSFDIEAAPAGSFALLHNRPAGVTAVDPAEGDLLAGLVDAAGLETDRLELYHTRTGHRLDMVEAVPVDEGLVWRGGDQRRRSVYLGIELAEWAPPLPFAFPLRLYWQGSGPGGGSAGYAVDLYTNSDDVHVDADVPTGRGMLVRRPDGVRVGATEFLFSSAPDGGELAGSWSPIDWPAPDVTAATAVRFAHPDSLSDAVAGIGTGFEGYDGRVTASFSLSDERLAARWFDIAPSAAVPTLGRPVPGAATETTVRFVWSQGAPGAIDSHALVLFDPVAHTPVLQTFLPAGVTETTLPLGEILGSGTYSWTVLGIRSHGNPYTANDRFGRTSGATAAPPRTVVVP